MPAGTAVAGAASAASPSTRSGQDQKLAAEAAPASASGNTGDASFAALGQSLGTPRATGLADAAAGRNAPPLPPGQAFGFDAIAHGGNAPLLRFTPAPGHYLYRDHTTLQLAADGIALDKQRRTEERRVGRECVRTCRSRWSPTH